MVQSEIGFDYIRMHGLFHEDMMVYRERDGQVIYNWQYIDLVFDHWLSVGIRPFVELGFMPYDLASGEETVFWWKGNITSPKDWGKWGELVSEFTRHCVFRYGLAEVRRWYFEVWNEPDLPYFWQGGDFDAYMKLYEHAVKAVKNVDGELRVGGPASSGDCPSPGVMPFVKDFLRVCGEKKLPVDFVSTHPYPVGDPVGDDGEPLVQDGDPFIESVMSLGKRSQLLTDIDGVLGDIEASDFSDAEIHLTEWSSSPSSRDVVHDCAFMASYVIDQNWMVRGRIDSISFWTVSDIFEEGRQGDTNFHGGFGMMNIQGYRKGSYHGYWFLSRLGGEVLAGGDDFAVTRRQDGTIVALFWNGTHYKEGCENFTHRDAGDDRAKDGRDIYDIFQERPTMSCTLSLSGLDDEVQVATTTFDRHHGSVYDAWKIMGSPYPTTQAEEEVLRDKGLLDVQMNRRKTNAGKLEIDVTLEPFGVTMLEIAPGPKDV